MNENQSIQEIWNEFLKTRNEHLFNQLLVHYKYLVKNVAQSLHSKLNDEAKLDDLIAAGIFGLIDAIEAFDPAKGLQFEAYCGPVIRVSILRELKSMDWVPQSVRIRASQLESEM